jgi:hypothetical protein
MSDVAIAAPVQPKPRRRRKLLMRSLATLFVVWICFVFFIGWAMRQPPEVFGNVMKRMPMPAYFLFPFETMWTSARKGTLHVNDLAPDFNLEAYDKSGTIQLSSFRGKEPVVLVFGSYT